MTKPAVYNKDKTRVYMEKHGLDIEHLPAWTIKFRVLRSNAKRKGVRCTLTLLQYVRLAVRAKMVHPDEIGMRVDNYCMGRHGDVGDYEWGNCRFITHAENFLERKTNGGDESGANKHRGRTKENDAGVKAAVQKNSKSFILTAPDGKKFRGINLSEFAAKHSLDRGRMSLVCAGKVAHHKGWTGSYKL